MARFISGIILTMRVTHRKINHFITLVVVVFALYIVAMPYWPRISWYFMDKTNPAPYVGRLRSGTEKTGDTKPVPSDNRIVIPSALIDQPILEGGGLWVVDGGGSWRKNINTSSPLETGNTVIIAHRFTYSRPTDGFYYLDKVRVGDKLALYWEGTELLYEVTETKTVPETAIEIEQNTTNRTLTLYTCTPVLTAENRLVVIAKPMEAE